MATDSLSHRRSALVVYGSETGTAEDIAEEIGRLTKRLRFATRVTELDNIHLKDVVTSDVVIIAISTTGQGDVPINARSFWKKLRSSRLKHGVLSRVSFTSFGIGDSSYPNFNWAARKLSNRLLQLGAQCFCDRGESDEQHAEGIEGLFYPWSTNLRDKLLRHFPLPPGISAIPAEEFLTPEWELRGQETQINGFHENTRRSTTHGFDENSAEIAEDFSRLPATLVAGERVTPGKHWQDVRLFEFSTPHVEYSPGDVLSIYPHNADEDVNELLKIMGWSADADKAVHLIPTDTTAAASAPPIHLGVPISLRTLIHHHLDLNAIPRRSFFATIAHFTTDPMQKQRLLEFTKPELIDELYDYTTRPRRSTLEVLQEFDTVKISWKWAASIFPRIRGRQFSIASGGLLKHGLGGDTRIQLLVAIVRYRTVIKKLRQGLCTRYLCSLTEGDQLQVALSKSGMQVAMDRPAIMVGPGTGVAPLRAMAHERAMIHERAADQDHGTHQAQMLFYGGRNRNADYFFHDEWARFQENEALQVQTAFSRDQTAKVYVQDKIRQCAASVFQLLQQGAVVYVCGSSGKMPQAVRAALTGAIETEGNMPKEDAEQYLVAMEKSGRYQQETW